MCRNHKLSCRANDPACLPVQIHGHDFNCITVFPKTSSPCYASGSEEKVIRILEAPRAFEDTLALSRGEELHASSSSSSSTHNQVCTPSSTVIT